MSMVCKKCGNIIFVSNRPTTYAEPEECRKCYPRYDGHDFDC